MLNRILIISLFGVVLMFSLSGCKKHTSKPAVEQLPPATQYGANTFGCLVDGKVFIPKAKFGNMSPILTCYYQYIYPGSMDGYVFQVAASDNSNPSSPVEVNVFLDSLSLINSKNYKLQNPVRGNANGTYIKFTNGLLDNHYTYSPSSGELSITKFDETYQIVSGTFWFTAVDTNGDTVKITDGRFDMKFTQ